VFDPFSVVRDDRTRYEVPSAQAVMNGELYAFIEAFLQQEARGSLQPEENDS
jgi:peptide chain release factor 2